MPVSARCLLCSKIVVSPTGDTTVFLDHIRIAHSEILILDSKGNIQNKNKHKDKDKEKDKEKDKDKKREKRNGKEKEKEKIPDDKDGVVKEEKIDGISAEDQEKDKEANKMERKSEKMDIKADKIDKTDKADEDEWEVVVPNDKMEKSDKKRKSDKKKETSDKKSKSDKKCSKPVKKDTSDNSDKSDKSGKTDSSSDKMNRDVHGTRIIYTGRRKPHHRKLYKTSIQKWRPGKGCVYCPKCGCTKRPNIRSHSEKVSNSTFGAAILLSCWPFCFLPWGFQSPSKEYLHCPVCNNFLGLYDRQSESVRPNRHFCEETDGSEKRQPERCSQFGYRKHFEFDYATNDCKRNEISNKNDEQKNEEDRNEKKAKKK